MRQFAPEYPRTEQGWIRFPADSEYRKGMFPEEVNKHPAKANVYLTQSIIEYVSKEGQLLLDIMSGTGTLMVGALISRFVICVEISQMFHDLQQQALVKLETIAPGISERIVLVNLPCQRYLPIPDLVDHIIFSPPYAGIMKVGQKPGRLQEEFLGAEVHEYSADPLNVGLMNDFIWTQEMERIYAKCLITLKPGGTMTLITKDHYEKQKDGVRKRIPLSQAARDACIHVGFTDHSWFKWAAPGSAFTNIYRSRGWEVVEDEDVITMKKGG
jgi:DNA modification methylase